MRYPPFPSLLPHFPFRPSWTDSQEVLCQPRRRTPRRRWTTSTCRTRPGLPSHFSASLPFPSCLPCSLRLTLVCQPQVLPPVRRPTSSYTSSVLVPASSRPTDAELVRLRPREQLERLLSPSYVLRSLYLRQILRMWLNLFSLFLSPSSISSLTLSSPEQIPTRSRLRPITHRQSDSFDLLLLTDLSPTRRTTLLGPRSRPPVPPFDNRHTRQPSTESRSSRLPFPLLSRLTSTLSLETTTRGLQAEEDCSG